MRSRSAYPNTRRRRHNTYRRKHRRRQGPRRAAFRWTKRTSLGSPRADLRAGLGIGLSQCAYLPHQSQALVRAAGSKSNGCFDTAVWPFDDPAVRPCTLAPQNDEGSMKPRDMTSHVWRHTRRGVAAPTGADRGCVDHFPPSRRSQGSLRGELGHGAFRTDETLRSASIGPRTRTSGRSNQIAVFFLPRRIQS